MPKTKPTSFDRASKRRKVTYPQITYPDWISASKTRNYLLKDPVLDFFNLYGKSHGYLSDEETNTDIQNRLDFGKFIMNQGVQFEKFIISEIKEKIEKSKIVLINTDVNFPEPHFLEIESEYLSPIPEVYKLFSSEAQTFLGIPPTNECEIRDMLQSLKKVSFNLIKEYFNVNNIDQLESILKTNTYKNTSLELQNTLNAMEKGIPIIYQGLVCDPTNMTYGYPDLIIRTDYLPYLITHFPYVSSKGCKFSTNIRPWHYCIVDIKFSTLHLRVDEEHLLNQGSVPAYKGQVAIYNKALEFMQDYVPEEAYILGRGWSSTYSKVCDSFDRLGVVNFKGVDEGILEEALSAVKWIRDLRTEGHKWILNPPSRVELRPNMCNTNDNGWHKSKKKLAHLLNDITLIWRCGIKERNIALQLPKSKRFESWNDPKCCAVSLGMKPTGAYSQTVNRILKVNRDTSEDKILYQDPLKSSMEWRINHENFIGFVDIETVSNVGIVNSDDQQSIIFMIGLYYLDYPQKDGVYTKEKFKVWIVNNFDSIEEIGIINKFIEFVTMKANGRNITLYHYSHAEPSSFKNAYAFHKIPDPKFKWIDLFTVIKEQNIVIKGALDFSLKTIVEALNKLGEIDIHYQDSDISSGLQAMVAAYISQQEIATTPFSENKLIRTVADYNLIDCKSLYSLVKVFNKIIKKV